MFKDRCELFVAAIAVDNDPGHQLVDTRRYATFGVEKPTEIESAFGIDFKPTQGNPFCRGSRDEAYEDTSVERRNQKFLRIWSLVLSQHFVRLICSDHVWAINLLTADAH